MTTCHPHVSKIKRCKLHTISDPKSRQPPLRGSRCMLPSKEGPHLPGWQRWTLPSGQAGPLFGWWKRSVPLRGGAHALLSDERAHPLGWRRWTLPTGRAGYSLWRERSVPAPRARYPPSWGSEPSPGRGNSANEPHHKPHLPPHAPMGCGGQARGASRPAELAYDSSLGGGADRLHPAQKFLRWG